MSCCNVVAILSMAVILWSVFVWCAETVQCMSNAGSVWYVHCEILLLLNVADIGRLLGARLWNSLNAYEMKRLSACREFCGVHS